ncbi:MAG: enolase [Chloroflexi bacterium]|nr:enolase [Chloroflexota bacterium]
MKITDVQVTAFRTWVDRFQNATPRPQTEIIQTVTVITTDEGVSGYYLGGQGHGDQDGLAPAGREHMTTRIKSQLVGLNPLDREQIWQVLWAAKTPENLWSIVDMALWDLLGRLTNLPVHKLLGGCRERVRAYASTYPNMGTPEEYAAHALACKQQGYTAYKIHPYYYWDPVTRQPMSARPSHINWDIRACEAIREAVGDDMVLMFDPWGTYHIYEEALAVGRALERLNFHWYEHPMPEHRMETYIRLARELSIPICSPEILEGSVFTRADWLRRDASDISRIDVLRGGITGARKTATVCEAYGARCEIHMSGIGNLQVLGATSEDTCEYYERGLLAPGVDYDAKLAYLAEPIDPMDSDGWVRVPSGPGLGYELDWDYVATHLVEG